MKIENQSPVTAQAEQATVHATGMESDNNGMKLQGSATPDSNGGAKMQSVPDVEEVTSATAASGTDLSNPYLKKWDGTPLQPGILYHRNQMIGLPECYIKENRSTANRADNWQKICREYGMGQPAKYVKASVAKAAGFTLVQTDSDGKDYPIPDEQVDRYYTKEDGNGRCAAHNKDLDMAMKDPSYKPFDFIFLYDDMTDPDLFYKQFISINFDTKKTTNAELTSYAAAVYKNPYTEYYNALIKEGFVAKAAAYFTFGKEPNREDMKKINSGKSVTINEKLIKGMRNALEVYKSAFSGNASAKLLHGVPLAKWTYTKIKEANDEQAIEALINKLSDRFENIKPKQMAELQDARGVVNDRTRTTEIVLRELFEKILKS